MHFGAIIILGLAVNLDNLLLGLSCGMAKKHIRWYHNLIIALVSGIFGGLSCALAHLIPGAFAVISAILGSLILFVVGAWTLVKGIKKREPVAACPIRCASVREIGLISVALALNSLAVSFAMGMSDVSFLLLGLSIAAFSFLGVGIGNRLGKNALRVIRSNWLDIVSGLLLIAIAVWEWLI